MSTITIDNPKIQKNYTNSELRMKFLEFLESELSENTVNLYEISVEDLSESSAKRFENRDQLSYSDY